MESTYFRRGFGLKAEIEGQLTADYHSTVVELLRSGRIKGVNSGLHKCNEVGDMVAAEVKSAVAAAKD